MSDIAIKPTMRQRVVGEFKEFVVLLIAAFTNGVVDVNQFSDGDICGEKLHAFLGSDVSIQFRPAKHFRGFGESRFGSKQFSGTGRIEGAAGN